MTTAEGSVNPWRVRPFEPQSECDNDSGRGGLLSHGQGNQLNGQADEKGTRTTRLGETSSRRVGRPVGKTRHSRKMSTWQARSGPLSACNTQVPA